MPEPYGETLDYEGRFWRHFCWDESFYLGSAEGGDQPRGSDYMRFTAVGYPGYPSIPDEFVSPPASYMAPGYDDSGWVVTQLPVFNDDYVTRGLLPAPPPGTALHDVPLFGLDRHWAGRVEVDFPDYALPPYVLWPGGEVFHDSVHRPYVALVATDNNGVLYVDGIGNVLNSNFWPASYENTWMWATEPGSHLVGIDKVGDGSTDYFGLSLATPIVPTLDLTLDIRGVHASCTASAVLGHLTPPYGVEEFSGVDHANDIIVVTWQYGGGLEPHLQTRQVRFRRGDVFDYDPTAPPSTYHHSTATISDTFTFTPTAPIGNLGIFTSVIYDLDGPHQSSSLADPIFAVEWFEELHLIPAPQRQFPRDDGLGISTRRSFPPPTSVQYGLRRGPDAIR